MLGENKEVVWNRIWDEDLDEVKGELLVRIWKEKERRRKGEKMRKREEIRSREERRSEHGGRFRERSRDRFV